MLQTHGTSLSQSQGLLKPFARLSDAFPQSPNALLQTYELSFSYLLACLDLTITITAAAAAETHADSIHRSTRATMRDAPKYRIQIVRSPASLPALVGHVRR